jgi:D-alanine-D-alanine ligase-like ATP-grasp enzyme
MSQALSICLVAGGPSAERGISLNSARSVCDHLDGDDIRVEHIVYFDTQGQAFLLPRGDLYSNTPSDFDFALRANGRPLTDAELTKAFTSGLVFPAIHGIFGEDGELQKRLEACNAAFVGTGSEACHRAFHKGRAATALASAGYSVIPTLLLSRNDADQVAIAQTWLTQQKLTWLSAARALAFIS